MICTYADISDDDDDDDDNDDDDDEHWKWTLQTRANKLRSETNIRKTKRYLLSQFWPSSSRLFGLNQLPTALNDTDDIES